MLKLFVAKEIVDDLKTLGHSLDSDYEIKLVFSRIMKDEHQYSREVLAPDEIEIVSNSLEDLCRQFADYLREHPQNE